MIDYLKSLTRKKTFGDDESQKEKLKRVLTLADLIGLGVGSTLGVGVYVLAGSVAKNLAGPAVVISFVVAAIASAFAGVCYAEFAARVPKAGSAYVYSYVSVGELVAFIIGWNLILEYVIGTASVAKALSLYIDALSNNTMQNTLREVFPIDINFLAPYPDFLSFAFVMVLAGLLATGVKESTFLNNCFTILNLTIITFVIIAGSLKADPSNWFIPKNETNGQGGEGGFMPYGIKGVMEGAAKCFFAFVGFDCIATTGEEAKNPRRNIPLSILFSLIIIFLAYFGISTVLTMMYPYYLQDPSAPFPHVFEQIHWIEVKWVVTIGAIFALCTSLLGAMFPLPRILYAMGNDGILFKIFSKVNNKTKTPLISTILSGMLAGVMAMLLDLDQLIDMMSIGTLLAYTIVAVCVLILRYPMAPCLTQYEHTNRISIPPPEDSPSPDGLVQFAKKILRKTFNLNMNKIPTPETASLTKLGVVFFSIVSIAFSSILIYAQQPLMENAIWAITLLSIFALLLILTVIIIARQPLSDIQLSFKVPMVPFIPSLSLLINIYLMLELDLHTWIRFTVWMFVGFLIYFCYGHKNSLEIIENSKSASERTKQRTV
ncbi:hypothetical protein RUM43_014058 [Polyplax serrata]|uniref:Cationic amino acid transporter C-terminal domain-containing protein n=1 Tax=Polyplax serrata TaxID=468196 RepID=A0AAN8NQU2_POLSC